VIEGRLTNRPAIGLVIGIVVTGLLLLAQLLLYLVLDGPITTFVGVVLAVPTAVVVLGLILLLDRLEPEPPLRLLFTFLWGAGVATGFSLVINTLGLIGTTAVLGEGAGYSLYASIGAPLVEESLKGAVLLILLWRYRDDLDGPTDALIYGGIVGIGFTLIEDAGYYIESAAAGPRELLAVVVMRGILSPLGHLLFTSLTALGVVYAARRGGGKGALAILLGWCAAMFVHFSWNFGTNFGIVGLAIGALIQLGVMILLIVLLVRDRRRTVTLIRRYLPSYAGAGIVTEADVGMLGSLSGRKQARNWAKAHFGRIGARAMADYQLAATELALLHSHAETRSVEEQRFYFRQQGLTDLMRTARTVFAQPLPGPPAHRPR
jgi:RsiW-degrading membrane proteinase PrsW (M82 family)